MSSQWLKASRISVARLRIGRAQCRSVWSEKTTPQPKVSPGRLRSTTVTLVRRVVLLHQQREVQARRAAADARDAHRR